MTGPSWLYAWRMRRSCSGCDGSRVVGESIRRRAVAGSTWDRVGQRASWREQGAVMFGGCMQRHGWMANHCLRFSLLWLVREVLSSSAAYCGNVRVKAVSSYKAVRWF